jgi:UDP-N-acetylglucosamine/UDP-N-acetyl-alpha-D-glucosaminouronate 4-epimerase
MRDSPLPAVYLRLRDDLIAMPRTWLITGVAGFIGSSLLEQLLDLGQRVVGLDNFSTGSRENLDDVLEGRENAAFRLIEGDIRNLDDCREACDGVDVVIHQAALPSVPMSIDDPLASHSVNVGGFLNVLSAARQARVSRVVYASSSAVYGEASLVPVSEERAGSVLSPYAADKLANEIYASVWGRQYGLQAIGLRYFNVFGRRQDPNGAYAAVIPRWVEALLRDAPCYVYGDGETTRDFCHVSDVVQANLLAAVAAESAVGEVYNVGCGVETSLNELFRMIRLGLVGYEAELASHEPVYEAFRPGDIRRSVADISKARRHLGFEPEMTVAEGLGEALEWYVAQARETEVNPR